MHTRLSAFCLCLVTIVLFAGCGSKPPASQRESTEDRLSHKLKDSVQTIMEKKLANIEYMIYGFINFDAYKVKKSTDNLIQISHDIKKKMPKRRLLKQGKWDKLCNNQQKIAGQIYESFKAEDYAGSRNQLLALLANCMDCHKLIRHQ